MDFHIVLHFPHIIYFAAWFGSVLASIYFLKSIEDHLTGTATNTSEYTILLETKVADTGFKGVILSGILLAIFYHG